VLLKFAHLAAACDPSAAAELQQQIPASPGPTAAELDSLENANIGGVGGLPCLHLRSEQWQLAHAVRGTLVVGSNAACRAGCGCIAAPAQVALS
jgi:hypothetical protein